MNRYVIACNFLLVATASRLALPAANASVQTTRALAPLAVQHSNGSVTSVSQSQQPPALATLTPRIGLKSLPGSLAVPLLELPAASGKPPVESYQAHQLRVPVLALPMVQVPAKTSAPKPAQKKLSSVPNLSPEELAALRDLEKPDTTPSSQMQKVVVYKELAKDLTMQTTHLCDQIQQRFMQKKSGASLGVSLHAQKTVQQSSLASIVGTTWEIARILQDIEKRPLTLAESESLARLPSCIDTLQLIFNEMKLHAKELNRLMEVLSDEQLNAIKAWDPSDLVIPGTQETEQLRQVTVDREELRLKERLLQHYVKLIKKSLGKLSDEQHAIVGAKVAQEA